MFWLVIYVLALGCGLAIGHAHARRRYHLGAAAFWLRMAEPSAANEDNEDAHHVLLAVAMAYNDTMPWRA